MTVTMHRSWAKDLDTRTLYELLKLRVEVFVVEQACAYPELDGRDLKPETRHFWLEGPRREVICTLRLMEEHRRRAEGVPPGSLVHPPRGPRARPHDPAAASRVAEVGDYPCRIDAQTYLEDMYSQHGFVRAGEEFLDDGIPHVPMVKPGLGPRIAGPAGRATTSAVTGYPFTAIVGHEQLRLALVLCAVRPEIGGVLIRGEKGTAKSTAVRGLAAVLAEAGFSRLVELPIGATEDRVIGSLDLPAQCCATASTRSRPVLLAEAHGGVLYVDEVNLLNDHLVDVLLDAAAMGRVHIERDGVSHSDEAKFILIGTMNPEEGELRPQLLDRFGLTVDVRAFRRRRRAGASDPATHGVRGRPRRVRARIRR